MSAMLSQQLIEIAGQIAPSIQTWPRRQPSRLMVGSKMLRYADMHSFFYQTRQIFGDRLYDFRSENPTPRIIDCGAHIGLASLFFKECYPGAEIHAFEADADLAEIARANLETFGAADVDLRAAAVWIHDNGVTFSHSQDDAGHVGEAGTKVPSVRLKSLLDETVDMLKVDVEGAEFDLIADCGDALRNVRRMIIEVHAMHADRAPIGKLLATLEDLDFRTTLTDLHAATWIPVGVQPPFSALRTDKYIFTVFAWR
jgi:FkbM family methyltransferase